MQNLFWPPSGGGSSSNASVGTNGIAIPGSSTLVAGKDPGALLKPLSVDINGVLNVAASSLPLPSGAATAALQTAGNASLASIDSKLTHPLPVSASSLPLPTGASTSALQSAGNASLVSIDSKLTSPLTVQSAETIGAGSPTRAFVIAGIDDTLFTPAVPYITNGNGEMYVHIGSGTVDLASEATDNAYGGAGVTGKAGATFVTTLPTLTNQQSSTLMVDNRGRLLVGSIASALPAGSNTIGKVDQGTGGASAWLVSASSLPLPTGAATEATLSAMSAKLPATLGQKTMANSMAVVIASDQSAVPVLSTPATPAALTVKQAAITVGTSAVRLTTDGLAPSASRVVLVGIPDAASTAAFYIGSSSVTSSGATRGIPIAPGQSFTANGDAGDYYIISDTAAQSVFVMEQE